jgi:hypothetical protein
MGDLNSVHGVPVAGSLYRTLSGSTIFDGNRVVRVHFDAGSGEILAFEDGSTETHQTVERHRREGQRVEEAVISIDSLTTGRIAKVTLLGEVRDGIREALEHLVGLRVLPPQVVSGSTGFEGDPNLRHYQVHLSPDIDSPPEQWYRVAGLVPNALGQSWSLLTLEPNTPESGLEGIQLWVPDRDVMEVRPGDPVTLHPDSR